MRTHSNGSALLTAVIMVLVITVIGVGIIRFAGRESIGATASAKEQALVACAEAARLQLLSKIRALGFDPTQLSALNATLGTTGTGSMTALGGHYDTPNTGIVLEQVNFLPAIAAGPQVQVVNQASKSSNHHGPQPVKVIARCSDHGRQLEVEFGVLFGL
jgi:hypothetical protein